MCTGLEGAAIAAAISAAGAGVNAYSQNQTLRSQDQAAAAGIRNQEQLQRQGEATVNQNVQKMSAAQSQANVDAASAKQLAAYRAALSAGSTAPGASPTPVAGASGAYKARAAQAGGNASDFVNALAASGAKTEGTQLERVQEGQGMADTASKLGLLNTQSQGQDYLTQLKIRAQQANPWLTSAGILLGGTGAGLSSYSGYNSGVKKPGAPAAPSASDLAGQQVG